MRFAIVSLAIWFVAASHQDLKPAYDGESNILYQQYEDLLGDARTDFIRCSLLRSLTSGDIFNVGWLLGLNETTFELVANVEAILDEHLEPIDPECRKKLDAFINFDTNFYYYCSANFPARLHPFIKGPFGKYLSDEHIRNGFRKAVDSKAHHCVIHIIQNTRIEVLPHALLEEALIKLCSAGSIGGVKALLANTPVNPACQGNKPLEIAVQKNLSNVVKVLLGRLDVDPSFHDHQLVKGDLSKVGPFTLAHLLHNPRFDPSAHGCLMAVKFYENTNLESLCVLLSHSRIDLHCLDDVLEEDADDEAEAFKQDIVRSMIPLLDATRQGHLETIMAVDFKSLHHFCTTTMYLTSLTFNQPKILEFLEKHNSSVFNKSLGIIFAARLDHVESLETILRISPIFQDQLCRFHYYEDYIGAALKSRAKRSLKFFFDQLKVRSGGEFRKLVDGLENADIRTVNWRVNLLWKYAEEKWANEPNLRGYILSIMGAKLFSVYFSARFTFPAEIIDHIAEC